MGPHGAAAAAVFVSGALVLGAAVTLTSTGRARSGVVLTRRCLFSPFWPTSQSHLHFLLRYRTAAMHLELGIPSCLGALLRISDRKRCFARIVKADSVLPCPDCHSLYFGYNTTSDAASKCII